MSLSAGPVAKKEENKKSERFIRQINNIRYNFGIKGFLISEEEAVKLWNSYFLPKYIAGK